MTPNRARRRAALSDSARAERSGTWGAWEEIPLTEEILAKYGLPGMRAAFRNAVYSVQVYAKASAWGEIEHAMVRRHDAAPVRQWTHMQRIKTEIFGAERTAVEVYPAESELVDDANLYHLWVLPEGVQLPFGLRAVKR